MFALGYSVWKESSIGTIFYRNEGKKDLSGAIQQCEDANTEFKDWLLGFANWKECSVRPLYIKKALFKGAGEINGVSKDKNIIEITLPEPQNKNETQFYQNAKTKFPDHQGGIWLNSDTPGEGKVQSRRS